MYTEFKAIVIGNELHLNKIAPHFGIQRKFKWEDPLLLKQDQLQGIVNNADSKMVYLFHFGSVVCVNLQHHEILDVIHYLKRLEPEIDIAQNFPYEDDYKLEVNPDADFSINNDSLVVAAQYDYHLEIIATILAKSVSLEKNENEVDALLDRIEAVVNNLSRGELGMTDSGLARMTANILRFRLNTLSYIMLLDNPDITWNNEEAASLHNELSLLFELKERYENLRHKTETLMDITEAFSGLVHARRGTRLEWAIIILIMIEIVLSLYSMFISPLH